GAVVCVLLAGWLGEGRRKWGLAAAVLLAVGLGTTVPAEAASLGEADAAYQQGQYEKAVRILTELSYDQPDNPDLFDRLGAARYLTNDYEGAARAWGRESQLKGNADSETLFDLGNAQAKSGRFERALQTYDELLGQGTHDRAQKNRSVIAAELERRRAMQQQQQQQQEQQQGGSEGEQDKPSDSQDGEQGESDGESQPQNGGEPKPGEEPGEEPKDPEDAPKEGEQPAAEQSGTAEGEREQSDREQSGDNPTEQGEGRKQTSDDQERKDESDSEGVSPSDLDSDGTPEEGGEGGTATPGELQTPEELAAQRAKKMLEGVEEGRPRVTIPGGSGDKPW
ncbi:MAG: tetratricopeptide repeat protein, partial [Myxococcota bacterium]